MKIVSWNVNGIRAAERKGFIDWLNASDADVVFLQEIKAHPEQLSDELREPRGWFTAFHPAQKPGYSGVAVYSRNTPDEVSVGLSESRFDDEGRVIAARFGDLHVIGAYFPNGARDLSRVPFKLDFYASMLEHARKLRASGLKVVVCGDWNTAHQDVDLARPKDNHKTTGFLPEEREWVTRFLADGWADAWRRLKPDVTERYTWWAPWQFARKKNIGWRIDFHVVDEEMLGGVGGCEIHDDVMGSDHCPISLTIAPSAPSRRIPVTSSSTPSGPRPAEPPPPSGPTPRGSRSRAASSAGPEAAAPQEAPQPRTAKPQSKPKASPKRPRS
jgi:exodeoxyribonuclease-3